MDAEEQARSDTPPPSTPASSPRVSAQSSPLPPGSGGPSPRPQQRRHPGPQQQQPRAGGRARKGNTMDLLSIFGALSG